MSRAARAVFQGACFISILFLGLYYTAYQSIIDIVAAHFNTPEAALGLVISLHFIGSIAGTLLSGEISERIGKKPVMMASVGLVLIGSVGTYLTESLIVICIGLFMLGFGFTALESMLASSLSDESGDKAARSLSFLNVFFSIGAVSAPMLITYVFDLGRAWREVYLCCAVIPVVLLAMFGVSRFGGRPKKDVGSAPVTLELLRVPAYRLTLIISFLYLGVEVALGFWAKPVMIAAGGTAEHGALALSLFWLAMIPGRFVGGVLYKHKGIVFNIAMMLGALGGALVMILPGVTARLVCYFIMGLGAAPTWPVVNALALEVVPKYSGACVSFMLVVSSFGGVVWPPLLSAAVSLVGANAALAAAALMYLAMFAFYAIYRREVAKPGAVFLLAEAVE